MNRDLFLAILSMDSYNRGYGQGLKNMPTVLGSTKIGNATILSDKSDASGLR
jgi:hypothetical protein